jgi:hypothetical protein
LENGIQVKGMGMDPGFHRGDDKVGMEIKIKKGNSKIFYPTFLLLHIA